MPYAVHDSKIEAYCRGDRTAGVNADEITSQAQSELTAGAEADVGSSAEGKVKLVAPRR